MRACSGVVGALDHIGDSPTIKGRWSAVVRSLQQLVVKQLVTGSVFAKGLKLIVSKDAF